METWRPVVGFEGCYEVSDQGRVRAVRGRHTGRMLTPVFVPNGYVTYHLYMGGARSVQSAHVLVLEAFVAPRPTGKEGCHNDNNKRNNTLANLRWDTPVGNNFDKRRHGTHLQGETNPGVKLTADQIRKIRRDGRPQQEIADEYGCTFSNISAIQLYKSWKHL